MATTTEFRIPTAEVVLGPVFAREPSLKCEMEQAAVRDFPGLWFTGVSRRSLEAAFEADPSVESYALISVHSNRLLYELGGIAELRRLFDTITENQGTVRSLTAARGDWALSARFPTRDRVSRSYERLEDSGFTVTVTRLCEGVDEAVQTTGLTREQYETLAAAIEHGYFEIPREITREELADELDISHQAVSERLRRAYKTLVVSKIGADDRDSVVESVPVA